MGWRSKFSPASQSIRSANLRGSIEIPVAGLLEIFDDVSCADEELLRKKHGERGGRIGGEKIRGKSWFRIGETHRGSSWQKIKYVRVESLNVRARSVLPWNPLIFRGERDRIGVVWRREARIMLLRVTCAEILKGFFLRVLDVDGDLRMH